jgi:CheY-like chemotaxis protein
VKAHSGEQALRCLLGAEFAVVLLDVNMPGLEWVRSRRSVARTRANPEYTHYFRHCRGQGRRGAMEN